MIKSEDSATDRFSPLVILLITYFLCRLLFQQFTFMKIGFIFPTGIIVEIFYGTGEFINKEWLFGIEHTQFVLDESCSGTTFFSLLFAYILYRIKTQSIPFFWLFLTYPIAVIANAMRVLSSIYAHNTLSAFNVSKFSNEAHVITGAIAFLCVFLIIAYIVENPNNQKPNEH